MRGEGVQPSRSTADLRPDDAARFAEAAQYGLEAAAAVTAGWSRRQLIDVALTLVVDQKTEEEAHAAALTWAAAEAHREARYQEEQSRRVGGAEVHGYARDRALGLERVYRFMAQGQ